MTGTVRIRDAERSRRAVLDAAEALFAARGFDGVGLREIASAADLSRQTPGYLFGSKEELYRAVVERVSADRQRATADALAPVHEWCEGTAGPDGLRKALAAAMESYMGFFVARPAFARFIAWEELAGAKRLRAARRRATSLTDAFTAVRRAGEGRGLRRFSVDDAVLLWFAPVSGTASTRTRFRPIMWQSQPCSGPSRPQRLSMVVPLPLVVSHRTTSAPA